MSDRVIAISQEVAEVGKKIADSKKRFIWRFRIDSTNYDLQLISSMLSGKRNITLNHQSIYSEQNVLNIKFDFSYNINGHSIRIFKQSETVHNYDLRIDNRSFEYLLKRKDRPVEQKQTGKYQATSDDPFSDFDKVAATTPAANNNSGFGDFDDFGSFDFAKPSAGGVEKVGQPKKQDIFDFNAPAKSAGISAESFETNNFSGFEKNFNNVDLLSEQTFATNHYGQYNNYIDLVGQEQNSQTYGQPVQVKEQTLLQKMTPDITGKQMFHKTMQAAVELKKKAVNQFQSLI